MKMGIIQGFSSMLRDGGVRSLWRGNGVNVIKIAPESAVKFMAFDKIKQMISKDINNPTTVDRLVSGSLAGALSNVIICMWCFISPVITSLSSISPSLLFSHVGLIF